VLNQLGMYPLAEDQPGQRDFAYDQYATHAVFPPGVTAAMIAANPEASRPDWGRPRTFWHDLDAMLDFNPQLGPDNTAIGEQARALVALHRDNEHYRPILDRAALSAYATLHDAATCAQAGLDAGNGWRRQPGAGLWGSDWYGRAIAAVIYIFVNDDHEAVYLTRGTDSRGQLLDGREHYTMTFDQDALPPVDRSRGRFLVPDHVQQGHLHARRRAEQAAQPGHRQPRRRRPQLRRRQADPSPQPPRTRRPGRQGELAARPGRPVLPHHPRLRPR
jgi:hypothetical protein